MSLLARIVAWVAGIVAVGWLWFGAHLDQAVMDAGRRDTVTAAGVLAVFALASAGAWYGYFRDRGGFRTWMGFLVAAWLFIGLGVWGGYRERSGGYIADYCAYGAVSQAQLDACIDHVDASEIDASKSTAARFARREFDECLASAGPFCEDFLSRRLWDDVRPGPYE